MYRRLLTSGTVAALACLLWVAPALAGGWAVITLDQVPGELRAGETYRVGYTVLQHGITPMRTSDTWIWVRPKDGRTLAFAGAAEGAAGHYVAEVRLPTAGEWTWEVGAGGFERQSLGTLNVLSATDGAQAAASVAPARASTTARVALSIATFCAGILFALEIVVAVRGRSRRWPATSAWVQRPRVARAE